MGDCEHAGMNPFTENNNNEKKKKTQKQSNKNFFRVSKTGIEWKNTESSAVQSLSLFLLLIDKLLLHSDSILLLSEVSGRQEATEINTLSQHNYI